MLHANKIALLARFVKMRAILWRDNRWAALAGPVMGRELS
jgi:hypothetical protein